MQRNIFWPLGGAVLIGFLAGACAERRDANTQTFTDAQAQGQQIAPATTSLRNARDLQALSSTYAAIAKRVTPAVVNINSQQIIPGRVLRDPMSEFFGGGEMFREPDRKAQSLGSGVIVDGRGVIVTNNHVIANASTITVTLNDRRRFPAKVLGADPSTDVAVLKIEGQNLPVLKWANSDQMQVGDIVLAIGSPFGLSSTVTQGILSAKGRRDLGISAFEDFLQTDAAINPGNSGGALVDVDGDLIGINSAILSESGGNQGIGLAIPSNLAKQISGQLLASGRVTRGWLGVVPEPVTDDVANRLGLTQTRGAIVTGIYSRSPAAALPWSQSGDDIIIAANGTPIDSPGQLRNLVAALSPGQKITLQVWQNGKTHEFSVTLGTRPARAQGV